MKNKDDAILESIAVKMYEQRAESDIYRSGDEAVSEQPSPMVYQVPASKFLQAARSVAGDWLRDQYKENLDIMVQTGLDEVELFIPADVRWDPLQGTNSLTLEDGAEMAKYLFGIEITSYIDPELGRMIAQDENVIIKINNEDGDDIEITDIQY